MQTVNRRGFFGWIAAAIGWLWGAKAKCGCGFVVCRECNKEALAKMLDGCKTYRLVKLDKTSRDQPDKYMWVLDINPMSPNERMAQA